MSPRWQRILISGGVAISVGVVAVPAVIGYALVRNNNDGSHAEVVQIKGVATVGATAMRTPLAIPSPTLSAVTSTPEATEEPLPASVEPSSGPPINQVTTAPQGEPPLPTSTVPPPPTILPVFSSIFAGPGVLFEPDDAEIDGLTVTVNGTVSSRDFKIARVVWDWGDGTVEEGWFPARHTYADPGRYVWSVTVYDDQGAGIAAQSSSIDLED